MRRPLLLALCCTLCGCVVDERQGSFAAPGATAGELAVGAPVFVLLEGNAVWTPGRVVAVDGDRARLERGSARLRDIVPAARLRPGDWVSTHGRPVGATGDGACDYREWLRVGAVTAEGVRLTCDGKEATWPLESLRLPVAGLRASFRAQGIVCLAIAALALWLLLAVRRAMGRAAAGHEAARGRQILARSAADAVGEAAAAPAAGRERLRVLDCKACGAVVPLAALATARCRSCGASVDIPVDYRKLAEARREIERSRPEAVSAVRRATIVTSPLVALGLVAAAVAVGVVGYGPLGAKLAGGAASGFYAWLVGFLLRAVPVVLVIVAAVVGLRRRRLHDLLQPLCAPPGKVGYDCRVCGAPLAADRDGVTFCDYCNAQNLVDARLASGARRAETEAAGLRASLEEALATLWVGVWRLVGVPSLIASAALTAVCGLMAVVYLVLGR